MSTQVSLALDQGQINRMLKSPSGTVGVYIYKLAVRTAQEVRRTAPKKTGHLQSNIIVNRASLGSVDITANVPYALALTTGYAAHVVESGSGKVMKFPSKKRGGQIVFAKKVHMPTRKGNPFMMEALQHTITMRL